MQSGIKKFDKWVIEFITEDPGKNPLMGWESSTDTYSELNLEFKSKIISSLSDVETNGQVNRNNDKFCLKSNKVSNKIYDFYNNYK